MATQKKSVRGAEENGVQRRMTAPIEKMGSVYLCGPITGAQGGQEVYWRDQAIEKLQPELIGIDPTRDITDVQVKSQLENSHERLLMRRTHGSGVVARNRFDLYRCDLVLACFLNANRVSIGSVGEIFWADILRKPVMLVRETEGNIHDHDMLNEIAAWIFDDLDEAILKAKLLFRTSHQ